jgi:hypothetical protein
MFSLILPQAMLGAPYLALPNEANIRLVLPLPSLFNRFKIKPPSFAFNSPVVDQVTTLQETIPHLNFFFSFLPFFPCD